MDDFWPPVKYSLTRVTKVLLNTAELFWKLVISFPRPRKNLSRTFFDFTEQETECPIAPSAGRHLAVVPLVGLRFCGHSYTLNSGQYWCDPQSCYKHRLKRLLKQIRTTEWKIDIRFSVSSLQPGCEYFDLTCPTLLLTESKHSWGKEMTCLWNTCSLHTEPSLIVTKLTPQQLFLKTETQFVLSCFKLQNYSALIMMCIVFS